MFERSVDQLKQLLHDPMLAVRCRQVAQRSFDLEAGVMNYLHLYRRLDRGRHSSSETTKLTAAETMQPHITLDPAFSVGATPYES